MDRYLGKLLALPLAFCLLLLFLFDLANEWGRHSKALRLARLGSLARLYGLFPSPATADSKRRHGAVHLFPVLRGGDKKKLILKCTLPLLLTDILLHVGGEAYKRTTAYQNLERTEQTDVFRNKSISPSSARPTGGRTSRLSPRAR